MENPEHERGRECKDTLEKVLSYGNDDISAISAAVRGDVVSNMTRLREGLR